MGPIIAPLLAGLGGAAAHMIVQLASEGFLKKLTVKALEYAASKTDNEVDDDLVNDVADAWGVPRG